MTHTRWRFGHFPLASLPTQVSTTGQLLVDHHALHFENRTPVIQRAVLIRPWWRDKEVTNNPFYHHLYLGRSLPFSGLLRISHGHWTDLKDTKKKHVFLGFIFLVSSTRVIPNFIESARHSTLPNQNELLTQMIHLYIYIHIKHTNILYIIKNNYTCSPHISKINQNISKLEKQGCQTSKTQQQLSYILLEFPTQPFFSTTNVVPFRPDMSSASEANCDARR